jgi:hypothetical protein
MNERIRELLTQAGVGDNWNEADWYSLSPEMVEKFAELIIEQCGIALSTMLRDMVSRGQAYDLIKQHFGVEE